MQNKYKNTFVNSAEISVKEATFITVIDEDTDVKFKSQIFKGSYNGQFKYFVIDESNDIYPVSLLSSTYAQIYSEFTSPLGHIEKDGTVLSWDMDRGDLQIEGLVSSGRYVA